MVVRIYCNLAVPDACHSSSSNLGYYLLGLCANSPTNSAVRASLPRLLKSRESLPSSMAARRSAGSESRPVAHSTHKTDFAASRVIIVAFSTQW